MIHVNRVNDRLMLLKVLVGKRVVTSYQLMLHNKG